MDLNLADKYANAVLQTWYAGARGGKDIADILFGEVSPSGKLPITIYTDLDDMPDFTDYTMNGRTYRFLNKAPLYPFGYGLNYANTQITEAACDDTYKNACENGVKVTVTAVNNGEMKTDDVVQVYVHVNSENEVKHPKLAAFKRISLDKGETKQIELNVSKKMFGTINENGELVFDGTKANIYVGFGQPDERSKELTNKNIIKLELN